MKTVKKLVIILICCFIISFFCVSFLGKKVNPILLNYLNLEVERVTSNVVKTSVNDILSTIEKDDLFEIYKNEKNEVEMIDYNTNQVNLILAKINNDIYSKLKKLEEGKIEEFSLGNSLSGNKYHIVNSGIVCEIPFGSLSGNGFLNNLGPIIPIKMSFLGQVSSNLKTKVTAYGINNLYLEIYVQIDIRERISLPKSSKDVTVSVVAPLDIKIISGIVPDYYGGIIDKNSQASFLEK